MALHSGINTSVLLYQNQSCQWLYFHAVVTFSVDKSWLVTTTLHIPDHGGFLVFLSAAKVPKVQRIANKATLGLSTKMQYDQWSKQRLNLYFSALHQQPIKQIYKPTIILMPLRNDSHLISLCVHCTQQGHIRDPNSICKDFMESGNHLQCTIPIT